MIYRFADCELDTGQLTLFRSGQPIAVEPQVFDLLRILAEYPDRVVTRDELIEAVWRGRIVSESAISARIAAARKAVGDDGKRQEVVRTVARRGLQMAVHVTREGAAPAVLTETSDLPRRREPDIQEVRYARNTAGQSLAYALTGEGPPLVRVGYSMTHLDEEWRVPRERRYFETIGARNRLLRFDPVGVGLSEACDDPVDLEAWAEHALAVADAAGFDRFSVFSQSGGALCALRLAARHPDRVHKLVVISGYAVGRTERRDDSEPDSIRSIIAEGWRGPEGGFATAYLMAYFPEGPLDAIADFQKITQASCSRDMALRIRDAVNADSVLHLLEQVRCPTLILHARHDGVHPLAQAQKLAAGIPNARLVVMETANQMPIYPQPEWPRMMRTMLDFLAG